MTKTRFFAHIVFQMILGTFLILVTVRLLPVTGWTFLPFLCCVYATHSFVTAIKMILTYMTLKQLHKQARQLSKGEWIVKDDDDASDNQIEL